MCNFRPQPATESIPLKGPAVLKLDMRLGDCLDVLPTLEAGSVHCCVTSPPYWALRSYLPEGHKDKPAELGLEATPDLYVAKMVEVFRAVKRVLRDDGTLWLNLGDSYHNADKWGGGGANTGKHTRAPDGSVESWKAVRRKWDKVPGLKPKDLVGIPWMVAFALRADGWYLRSDIIWNKRNPMPESCTDRPTKSHEYVFLLTKSARYFYDADAVREESSGTGGGACFGRQGSEDDVTKPSSWDRRDVTKAKRAEYDAGRNKRSVWTISTQPYAKAHFATFPEALVLPCILAGTSEEGCCAECGAPYVRVKTVGWEPACKCGYQCEPCTTFYQSFHCREPDECDCPRCQGMCECRRIEKVPCTVLDPFLGSGTVAKVAQQYGRSFVGCELSPEYLELARDRFKQSRLFA